MDSMVTQSTVLAVMVDAVLAICRTSDFPNDKIYEFSRIVKPGGLVFVCTNSEGEVVELQQALQRRVGLASFLEPQSLDLKSIKLPIFSLSVGIKANQPSWKIGSSFTLKKPAKTLFKVNLDDDLNL